MTDDDNALKSDDHRRLERRPITLDEALKLANDTMERAERGRAEAAEREAKMNDPLETLNQFHASGTPSAVTIDDCKPPDRVAIALESIAASLRELARPSSKFRLVVEQDGDLWTIEAPGLCTARGIGPTIHSAVMNFNEINADFDKRFTEESK